MILKFTGPWVIGGLFNQIWSFQSGSTVSNFSYQAIVNYNLSKGWFLTFQPVISANFQREGSNQWTVPMGLGVGRVTKIGRQPINVQLHSYYNVVRPDGDADWTIRFQLTFLFPKK